jgi:hypothetical protein
MLAVVGVGAGAACLAAGALAWSGRWRSWARRPLLRVGAMPITWLPGLGAFLLVSGLANADLLSASSTVARLAFVLMVVGFLLCLVRPRWWGPRWYRTRDRTAPIDLGDPATALIAAGSRALSPGGAVSPRSATPAGVGAPLRTWRGSWVVGDETETAVHGLTHAGAVYGHLRLHPAAITFVASRVEDLLREEPTVLTVDVDDLRGVRVVPAGAGPDGRPRKAVGARSLWPRLVLDSGDAAYLFEVQFPNRTARRIRASLAPDAGPGTSR